MAKKKCLIFIAIMVILAGITTAANLDIKHTGPSYVQAGAEVSFNVTVTNDDYKKITLGVNVDPLSMLPSSWFDYVLLDNNNFVLNAHESKTVEATIKLKDTVPTDENYATYIQFTSPLDPSISVQHGIIMRVVPPEDILDMSVSAPDKVAPGGEYAFQLMLKNNLNTQLKNVKVSVSSELFNDEKSIMFFALQDRTEDYRFKAGMMSEPKPYELSIRVFYNDQIIERSTAKFSVSENKDVKEKREEYVGFLTRTVTITKTNYGNSLVEEKFDAPLTKFQEMFVSYTEDPVSFDVAGAHWIFSLSPDASKTVSMTVNYRPLGIAAIILLLFVIMMYYWMSRGIYFKKEIFKIKETKEGISEMKILLHIKNNTSKSIKNMTLMEILPKMFEPEKTFGTLNPEKVQRGEKGTRLLWTIPEIVRGEERIIFYQAKTKINLVGSFMLPPALIRYKGRFGKLLTLQSNSGKFSVGESKGEKLEKNQ